MKMSNSTNNIHENIIININSSEENITKKLSEKRKSLQPDNIKEEIYIKLNQGTILNFIRTSYRKETFNIDCYESSSEMKYDLNMINRYEEKSDTNLSFISEFDLEEAENKNNESFDSCLDENSVEEIEIVNKEN